MKCSRQLNIDGTIRSNKLIKSNDNINHKIMLLCKQAKYLAALNVYFVPPI